MLVVRCLICEEEVMRAKLVGYQHAPRLRKHLASHSQDADTFSSRDVLQSFLIEQEDERGDD